MENKAAIFKTALILVMIFIIGFGAGIGSAVVLWQIQLRPFEFERSPERTIKRLTRMLDLDSRQQAEVERIVRQTRTEIRAIRKEIRPKIHQVLDQSRRNIAAVLNEEQQKKFDRYVERNKKWLRKMQGRFDREMDNN